MIDASQQLFAFDEPAAERLSCGPLQMEATKRADGFWITNTPACVEEMGPYVKLSDAQEDMDGVCRCLENLDDRGFFTTGK